ncbi:MAG: hypothetical protein F6K58_26745 [Symploca sp. SIO2E9]|nr:hypothetical protein [Symploca sp. SIO2E9]
MGFAAVAWGEVSFRGGGIGKLRMQAPLSLQWDWEASSARAASQVEHLNNLLAGED